MAFSVPGTLTAVPKEPTAPPLPHARMFPAVQMRRRLLQLIRHHGTIREIGVCCWCSAERPAVACVHRVLGSRGGRARVRRVLVPGAPGWACPYASRGRARARGGRAHVHRVGVPGSRGGRARLSAIPGSHDPHLTTVATMRVEVCAGPSAGPASFK